MSPVRTSAYIANNSLAKKSSGNIDAFSLIKQGTKKNHLSLMSALCTSHTYVNAESHITSESIMLTNKAPNKSKPDKIYL